jgi:peptide/nickel transport system permease protein
MSAAVADAKPNRRLLRLLVAIGPGTVAAGAIIVLFLACAIGGQMLAPHDALAQNIFDKLNAPDWGAGPYWLGTDQLGRDMLSRIIVGARPTAIVAALCILIGGGIGGMLGVLAGFYGGRADLVLMRAVDATLSFPAVLLALLFAVVSGPGIASVVATISIVIWANFARIVRAAAAGVRHRDWIRQARVNGCSDASIVLRHVVPHVLDTWFVIATTQVAAVIVLESSLSFLGVGVAPPQPSWGQMTAAGRDYLDTAWWVAIFPAIAITLVIIAFNILGDRLRDWLDPHSRTR